MKFLKYLKYPLKNFFWKFSYISVWRCNWIIKSKSLTISKANQNPRDALRETFLAADDVWRKFLLWPLWMEERRRPLMLPTDPSRLRALTLSVTTSWSVVLARVSINAAFSKLIKFDTISPVVATWSYGSYVVIICCYVIYSQSTLSLIWFSNRE